MAKFGFFGKALAGAGQGLALAGQLGFEAKMRGDLEAQRFALLAKRDEVLQRYEGGRLDRDIAARAAEGTANRATQEKGFMMHKEAHLEGIDKQLQAKDNKPIALPKGAKLIAADGTVLASNLDGDDAKPITVPEGAAVVDQSGKQLYKNPKDPNAEGLPKLDTDIDNRINSLRSTISARMGTGFLEKLNDTERKEFDTIFTKAAKMIRQKTTMEDAYAAVIDDLDRLKARAGVKGESGGNTKAQEFRKRFGY